MRPFPSSRQTWCRRIFRRYITTRPATSANIEYELLNRPPRTYLEDRLVSKSDLLFSSIPGISRRQIPRRARLKSPDGHPVVPQGHHLVGFAPAPLTDDLLPDGTDSDHSPGPPFTRRLWAGGSVTFSEDWKLQMAFNINKWACQESITDVRLGGAPPIGQIASDAAPNNGDKVFVDIERQYKTCLRNGWSAAPAIVERRTLCFMRPKTAQDIKRDLEQPTQRRIMPPRPDIAPQHSQSFCLTSTALFRFSALTFNAHKIHLDRQHCREVEGYRDLLVHGPLLLVLMLSVLTNHGLIVRDLTYKNLAPVFVDEKIKVCLRESREGRWYVWIAGPDEDLRVKGTVIIENQAEDVRLKQVAPRAPRAPREPQVEAGEAGPDSHRLPQNSDTHPRKPDLLLSLSNPRLKDPSRP
ncbi:unnamed protein product [Discula destructiva]